MSSTIDLGSFLTKKDAKKFGIELKKKSLDEQIAEARANKQQLNEKKNQDNTTEPNIVKYGRHINTAMFETEQLRSGSSKQKMPHFDDICIPSYNGGETANQNKSDGKEIFEDYPTFVEAEEQEESAAAISEWKNVVNTKNDSSHDAVVVTQSNASRTNFVAPMSKFETFDEWPQTRAMPPIPTSEMNYGSSLILANDQNDDDYDEDYDEEYYEYYDEYGYEDDDNSDVEDEHY